MNSRFRTPFDEMMRELRGPTNWRVVAADDCADKWSELREWVHWFKDRYALDHRVVPPCWYLHTALVDLLTALRDLHTLAFDEMRPPNGAAEWHRIFRDLEPRLREWAARTGCNRDLHRPDVTIEWPDDKVRWEQHIARDELIREARENAQPLDDAAPAADCT